jgi:ribosomal protein L40E
MAGTEQDAAVLKAYGIDVQEHAPGEAKPKGCSRCNEINSSDATYCLKCWLTFDLKTALDQEKRVTTMTEALTVRPEVDPVIKTVLESMPEETKLKLLESVLLGLQKKIRKITSFIFIHHVFIIYVRQYFTGLPCNYICLFLGS